MPLLHESAYLEGAIASIRNQVGVQIIVVAQDNLSDDSTYSKFKELTYLDDRFHISRTGNRLSQSDNWNSLADFALGMFDSDFVIWLGGDDIWEESTFLVKLIERINNGAIAACPIIRHSVISEPCFPTNSYCVELESCEPDTRFRALLSNWRNVNAIHALYRREFFMKILNSNTGRPFNYLGFDWWWVLRAIQLGPIVNSYESTMDKRIKRIDQLKPSKALVRFLNRNLNDLLTFYSRTGYRSEIPLSWKLKIRTYFTYRILRNLIGAPVKSRNYIISKL